VKLLNLPSLAIPELLTRPQVFAFAIQQVPPTLRCRPPMQDATGCAISSAN